MGFPHNAGKFQVCSCCLESKAQADCSLKIKKGNLRGCPAEA